MTVIRYILVILLSYVLGCSNMALYLSKLRGVDMRKGGSGNLGASNAMILMGWKAGIIVAVHDIGKAVVAVVLAKHFCPSLPLIGAAAGVACVLGHMFPFYLRFRKVDERSNRILNIDFVEIVPRSVYNGATLEDRN